MVRKPRKIDFQPILVTVQTSESARRMDIKFPILRGRVTLVKTVLSAMPRRYMQALKVSKEVIIHIDKMRRNLLWKENDACKGINCLVNWDKLSMCIKGE